MKKILKWAFIICTLGIGWLLMYPFRDKADDTVECYYINDVYINMWAGPKRIKEALEVLRCPHEIEDHQMYICLDIMVTQRGFNYIKKNPDVFITRSAHWRESGNTRWKDFN